VVGVEPANHRIAALIFISGLGFYTKPYCTATTTPLAGDGSFTVLLTTGGIDQYATMIALFAVPATATVPCYMGEPGVPAALEQQAVAGVLVHGPNLNQREIQFSGETWLVKSSPAPVGPGPNYFSDSPENVWIDGMGRLHLRITFRNGLWHCAEIVSKRVIGYGQYSFQIDTLPQFDRNVVFGAFSWAEAERISREVDMLELGRFGNAGDPNNAQYVVQPYTTPGNQRRFVLPQLAPTVHRMAWLPGNLRFWSSDQVETPLQEWIYGSQPPATDSERLNFRFNLWPVAPPSDGNEAEIVVSHFTFTPTSKVGSHSNGAWILDKNGNFAWDGTTTDRLLYWSLGRAGEIFVIGDWNGDGKDEIGLYVDGTWQLDYNGNGLWDPGVDKLIYFGGPGYKPYVGDWNGDGKDDVGAYLNGAWILDWNGNFTWDGTVTDKLIYWSLGRAGEIPILGDWNGDGKTKLGLYVDGTIQLDYNGNGIWEPGTDKLVYYGGPGYTPYVGDWDGNGTDNVGAYQNGTWILDWNGNFAWDGTVTDRLIYWSLGRAGEIPILGDWNGNGQTKLGLYVDGTIQVDYDGNAVWNASLDKLAYFGGPGQKPVIGSW
jgi:hypothetical protein